MPRNTKLEINIIQALKYKVYAALFHALQDTRNYRTFSKNWSKHNIKINEMRCAHPASGRAQGCKRWHRKRIKVWSYIIRRHNGGEHRQALQADQISILASFAFRLVVTLQSIHSVTPKCNFKNHHYELFMCELYAYMQERQSVK